MPSRTIRTAGRFFGLLKEAGNVPGLQKAIEPVTGANHIQGLFHVLDGVDEIIKWPNVARLEVPIEGVKRLPNVRATDGTIYEFKDVVDCSADRIVTQVKDSLNGLARAGTLNPQGYRLIFRGNKGDPRCASFVANATEHLLPILEEAVRWTPVEFDPATPGRAYTVRFLDRKPYKSWLSGR